jgi:hypothetical protein
MSRQDMGRAVAVAPAVVLSGIGLALCAWAVTAPQFRDAGGFAKGTICLPLVVGLGTLILAWTMSGPLRRAAFWLALALVGQAVSLQMINAGPLLHYQHYWPMTRLVAESPLLVAFLALQSGAVLVGLRRRWPRIEAWISTTLRWWRVAVLAGILLVSCAALQRDVVQYAADVVLAALIQIVNLMCILLLAGEMPERALLSVRQGFDRLLGPRDQQEEQAHGDVDRFVLLAALWVAVVASILCVVIYQSHPHITDELAYLYQARFFAAGALTLPAPPVPEAFDFYLRETQGGQWFLPTPPGWPALLAVGVRLGVPWLVNPLLAGLNIVLLYVLLQHLYDRRLARASVLLLSLSPWYVFMAMNFMTHMVTLTSALLAAVAVVWARRTARARWGLVAGAAIGFASLIRPVDGAIIGVIIGLWAIGVGGQRLRLSALAGLAAGVLIIGGLALPYNQTLTGSPMVFPLNAYMDSHFGPGKNDLGFGPNRGYGWPIQPFPGHSPLGALVNTALNLFSTNVELFGWSIGSLAFVSLTLLSGSLKRSDYLMIAVCLATFVPYFFYWYSSGPDFGARYWFLMAGPLVALTVQGVRWLQSKLEMSITASPLVGTRVTIAVASLCLLALINYVPWRALDKYYHFWGMRPDVVSLSSRYGFGRSLVLIRGTSSYPDFASAAIYNPLRWDADAPIYAWDSDQATMVKLLNAFADRRVWIVDAPSLTNGGYEVVEGPLSSQDLLSRAGSQVMGVP